jgi:ribosome maturation factor RimP
MERGQVVPSFILRILNMINEKKITDLVLEKISETDIYLVDISIKPTNKIFIEVDSLVGLQIKDCIQISRHVEQNLDREIEDFELQVSSPGLDEPFKILKQYQKYIDKELDVLLKNGQKHTGKLLSANNEEISFEIIKIVKDEKTKKKKTLVEKVTFSMNEIKETKVLISFK